MTNASNKLISLPTKFGPVSVSPETFDVASVVCGRNGRTIAGVMEADIERVQEGLDVEKLREECCEGTDPGSDEEAGWSDWVDAVEAMANA